MSVTAGRPLAVSGCVGGDPNLYPVLVYSCLQTHRELGAPSSHGKHIFFLRWTALVMCHSRQSIGSGHLWWWPSLQWLGDMAGLGHSLSLREVWVGQP